MISKLKLTFHDEVLSGNVECRTFFDSLKEQPAEQVVEFCQWVVSNYEYEMHADIVKAAFHQLAHLRDVSSLKKLEELKGVWKNTYLSEYEYLIELLNSAESGAICNCDVYQDGRFNVPPYQNDLEIIGHSSRTRDDEMQNEVLIVNCKICGTKWEVEIDSLYLYPHSHWRKKSSQ